jgi:Ser/Thr protein kinase RdoA (MazF antagonist)
MFGKAIGFLHTCFLRVQPSDVYEDIRLLEQISHWAIPCIQEHTIRSEGNTIKKIWQETGPEITSIYAELPVQLIHRDLHPANMLFDMDKVTGFLDFEMVLRGPRIFDLCYCGTSLLVSAFPNSEKMQIWPSLFLSLVNGYQEMHRLNRSEIRALPGILATIELIFAAFSFETHAESAAECNLSVLKWISSSKELGSILSALENRILPT